MRVYLVIMDETEEARARCASPRAARPRPAARCTSWRWSRAQEFNAFGGVQATIEEEARDRAEVLANSAAGRPDQPKAARCR